MKKIVTTALGLSSMIALAQGNPNDYTGRVGINTITPKATLEISKNPLETDEKRPQGVLFPSFSSTERAKFEQITVGTMIFNTDKQCLEIFAGNPAQWSCITTMATNTGGGTPGGSNPGGSGSSILTPNQGAVPGTVTLKGNSHFIASIYDDNYLPYTAPTTAASVGTHNPDSQNDTVINVPGVIPENGIMVQIPITATGSGTLTGSTFEATIIAEHTKGTGNTDAGTTSRKVVLTWPNTAFTTADQYITAKIQPNDGKGEIQVRRLDLNKGIGNNGKGIEIASFTYNANTAGTQQATFKLHAIAGVPDKKFGVQTNNKLEHQFIYIPIQGPDGKLWLNNNLGAEYANITSPYFNPIRQAGALDYTNTTTNAPVLTNPTADQIKKDWRAYGYLYEWKRDSDGHEVIQWTSSTQGTFANPNLHNYNNTSPNNPSSSTMGDPCPSGFHTPTKTELESLHNSIVGSQLGTSSSNSNKMWQEKTLKLPAAGYRYYNSAALNGQGSYAWYWSSTESSSTSAWHLFFNSSSSHMSSNYRTDGPSVRCIAD